MPILEILLCVPDVSAIMRVGGGISSKVEYAFGEIHSEDTPVGVYFRYEFIGNREIDCG